MIRQNQYPKKYPTTRTKNSSPTVRPPNKSPTCADFRRSRIITTSLIARRPNDQKVKSAGGRGSIEKRFFWGLPGGAFNTTLMAPRAVGAELMSYTCRAPCTINVGRNALTRSFVYGVVYGLLPVRYKSYWFGTITYTHTRRTAFLAGYIAAGWALWLRPKEDLLQILQDRKRTPFAQEMRLIVWQERFINFSLSDWVRRGTFMRKQFCGIGMVSYEAVRIPLRFF